MPHTVRCPSPRTLWGHPIQTPFRSHYHPAVHTISRVPSRDLSTNSKPGLMNTASDFGRILTGIESYAYTSGRFLRRDKLEVDARYTHFDFPALCRKAIDLSMGANAITNCRKIEGGFNRVFIFTLDNGNRLVGSVSIRGPCKLSALADVSTIRYLQLKTTIPIPKIVNWNHDANHPKNPVGSEYIIMEHASEKEPFDTGFCIGPHCSTRYWDVDVREAKYYHNVKPNHGGWETLGEFSDGLIDAGLSRVPPTDTVPDSRPTYHGSPEAHAALLKAARSDLKQMALDPQIQKHSRPLLLHPDLHKRNIFVSEDDPTVITPIIDWQGASVEPAFWYSDEIPDFATEHEIIKQAFDLTSQYYTPQLAGPQLVDQSLFRPFIYSDRTWRDGAVALRQELIETSRLSEELAEHMKEYRLFEAAQELRVNMDSVINTGSGGWVPTGQWEAAQVANKDLYQGVVEAVLSNPEVDDDEPVQDEETLRSIWPFDLPQ
ncbi:hypothetical protein BJX65DRAFT_295555 [Aspergillus insuetus]